MKSIRCFISTICVFCLIACSALNVSAETNCGRGKVLEIKARVTNLQTGEVKWIPAKHLSRLQRNNVLLINNDGEDMQSFSDEVEADFDITDSNSRIGLQEYGDTSETQSDVKAKISIFYDRSITKRENKIRVNRVSGSWKPLNSQIFINSREVWYNDGVLFGGNSAHKKPKSNSFSYTTGWGWVTYYPASQEAMTGARAFSEAIVGVSGMSSHRIEVFVTVTR